MGKRSTSFVYAGIAAIVMAGAAHTSAELSFNAVVSFPTNNAGVYSFTTEKYDPQLIKRNVYASGGGIAYDDGYYYSTRVETVMGITAIELDTYDMGTWELYEKFSGSVDKVATASTFDRDLGQAYGCFFNADGETFRFCTLNVAYYSPTKIADLPKGWGACGFNKDNVLYAIDEDGMLMTVNTDNGQLTEVGDTGLKTEWITGGLVDKESNTMIYAVKTSTESALYSIDLATAKASKLYDLANEEQLGGFFIPEPEYAAEAPAKSSSISLNVSGANLSGNLAFYPPSTTVGGTQGSGDITYHVYCNGKEIATGTCPFKNARQTVPVSVEKAGYYSFAVSFSNEAGEGPRKRADLKWMGYDTPAAPTSVNLSETADGIRVTWQSSSSGIHRGTIDTANRTYRVTRYPDGVVVTPTDHKTTSFTDKIDMPAERTKYWYTVEVVIGDVKSPTGKSAEFELGPITPAYSVNFDSSTKLFGYKTLNPGADTNKWSYDSDKVIKVSTSKKPADNWLLLPPLNLKKGNSYTFTMKAYSYSDSYTEEFEVFSGTEGEVSALTTPVLAKTTVNGKTPVEFTGTITASGDGLHYVGIHATTPQNGGYLYVKSLAIEAGVSYLAPGAVTDLVATPDATGAHKATITFTTPAVTLGNDALDEITRVELLRDGTLVKTVTEGIAIGTAMTITDDTEPTAGKHTYSVVCHNSYGSGAEAKADAFIGFAAPEAVTEVQMTEPRNGHVVATWTAVTRDADGRTLTEKDVKYNIYKYLAGESYPVATGVSGTTYEYDAFDGFEEFDGQRFVQTLVEAVTEGGNAKIVPSAMVAIGNPYTTPWSESFANCEVKSIFANQKVKGSDAWQMVPADDFGTTPADNDGGMMYLEAYSRGACALITGKIDLGDMFSPAFTFQVFHYASSSPNENLFEVEVRTPDTDYVPVFSSKIMDMGPEAEWCKNIVSLEQFAGQVVQLRITATNNTFGFSHMDDFRITSVAANNLSLSKLTAPLSVDTNTDFNITAVVENLGTERATGYKVNLMRGDELVETKQGQALESGETAEYTFTNNLGVLAQGDNNYTVTIEYGIDMYDGDNSRDFVVTVRGNALPTVTTLAGEHKDGTVSLTWQAPATPSVPVASTENFDAPSLSWATSIPGWTMVDLDRGTIGGIGSKQLPVSGRQAFFVFNNTLQTLQSGNIASFNAHSGNQYLCAMYSNIGNRHVANDDWAISPELDGCAQMISLYATSFPADPGDTQYLETFQLLYSTTGTDTDDFVLVEQFSNIPAQWKEYSAYLPEGAKYFAIRCISNFQYMLFVDDVTFIAKDAQRKEVEINGYNVYRDGEKLNNEPVTTTTYTDSSVDNKSTYSYLVTALYADGESLKSNEVSVDTSLSGIDGAMTGSISITAAAGKAIVTGAEGMAVEVVAADGKVVASLTGGAYTSIPLAPGFYIVKAGDKVAKVAIP